jgi:MFS family permease
LSSDSSVPRGEGDVGNTGYSLYVLGVMFVLTMLNVMDRQVLSIVVEPVRAEFGLSDSQMGILTGSAFAFANLLAVVPVGRMADLSNRAKVIAGGLFVWSALTALTGASRAYWHLFLTRVGVGACETVGSGPAQSLIADYFPPERRGMALSILASGGMLGAMAGFAIGGLLADAVGWRQTFIFFGVPGMFLAILLVFTVRDPGRANPVSTMTAADVGETASDVSTEAPTFLGVLRYLFGLRSFRHLVVGGSLNSFENWSLLAWAPAAMMRAHGLTATEVGARLATSMTLFSALGLVLAGFLADRLGRHDLRWYMWLPATASVTATPFLVAFLIAADPDVGFVLIMPGALLNTMWVGSSFAVVQLLAHSRMRATAGAIFSLITAGLIGQGLGPAFVGVLSDHLAPQYGSDALRYALAFATISGIWGAIHLLIGARSLIGDLAEAKSER